MSAGVRKTIIINRFFFIVVPLKVNTPHTARPEGVLAILLFIHCSIETIGVKASQNEF